MNEVRQSKILAPDPVDTVWVLAGQIEENGPIRYVPVNSSPFRVGRRMDLSLCLPHPHVSSLHAEIIDAGEYCRVRDLKSTNGTFVNGVRVKDEAVLNEGDLVQFANIVFRVGCQDADGGIGTVRGTVENDACDWALTLTQFDRLMNERLIVPFFQPIVLFEDARTIGYELLARSRLYGLKNPRTMFLAATQLNVTEELSEMMRWEGIRGARSLPELPNLFVNTHPSELGRAGLVKSLRKLREFNTAQMITLEIHEAAVTDLNWMRELRAALKDLNMQLAYDDFGAGQSRLLELVEVRPDYLKFDIKFVRGIHAASAQRQQMLATLVRLAKELGVWTLAEGIECEDESVACRQLGFEFGQGYYFGKPASGKLYAGARRS